MEGDGGTQKHFITVRTMRGGGCPLRERTPPGGGGWLGFYQPPPPIISHPPPSLGRKVAAADSATAQLTCGIATGDPTWGRRNPGAHRQGLR